MQDPNWENQNEHGGKRRIAEPLDNKSVIRHHISRLVGYASLSESNVMELNVTFYCSKRQQAITIVRHKQIVTQHVRRIVCDMTSL